jgi:flagellar protein FliO/FliZ
MDTDAYLRFALALVLVLGLIALIAWLVRRFGLAQRRAPGSATPRRVRRLGVVEVCAVDGRRRLVLIKRDGVEHLLLLSGTGSGVVVERGIGAEPPARSFSKALAEAEQDEDDDAAAESDESETRPIAPGAGLPGKPS